MSRSLFSHKRRSCRIRHDELAEYATIGSAVLLPAAVSAVRARCAEGGVDDHDEDDDYDDDYALPGPLAAAGASEVDMPVLLEDVLKGLPAISPARSPPAHDLRSWGGDAEPAGAAWGTDEHEHAALGPDGAAPVLRAPGTRAPGFFAALRLVYGRGPPTATPPATRTPATTTT